MTASIARMNLALHGIEDFAVARGDTLERPAFNDLDRLRTFDIVLANPPYSIKQWNREAWQSDPWRRNFLGTPPQGRADYAFFQHILASMDPECGRCAILFPHGVLFRKEEAEMRRKGELPPGVHLGTSDQFRQLVGVGYVGAVDVRNLPTAVVDLDQTVVSRQLESSFTASGYFLVVARPDAETQLTSLLDTGVAKVALVIPQGTQDLLAGRALPVVRPPPDEPRRVAHELTHRRLASLPARELRQVATDRRLELQRPHVEGHRGHVPPGSRLLPGADP